MTAGMERKIPLEQFVWVPIDKAVNAAPGLVDHLTDRWWTYVEGKGIAFYRPRGSRGHLYPQCNSDRTISEKITARYDIPDATVIFLPSVFMTHRCES